MLGVYLSEQHKLGKLPRQHEAQVGDAQGDHGCPARVPLSVTQTEENMNQRSDGGRAWGCNVAAERQHKCLEVSRQPVREENTPPAWLQTADGGDAFRVAAFWSDCDLVDQILKRKLKRMKKQANKQQTRV